MQHDTHKYYFTFYNSCIWHGTHMKQVFFGAICNSTEFQRYVWRGHKGPAISQTGPTICQGKTDLYVHGQKDQIYVRQKGVKRTYYISGHKIPSTCQGIGYLLIFQSKWDLLYVRANSTYYMSEQMGPIICQSKWDLLYIGHNMPALSQQKGLTICQDKTGLYA